MTPRFLASIVVLASLAACGSQMPESNPDLVTPVDTGRGVGFGSYEAYEAQRVQRERELNGTAAASAAGSVAPSTPVISSEELRSAGLPASGASTATAPLPAADPVSSQPLGAPSVGPASAGASSQVANVAPAPPSNNAGISDEQSFAAVSARETIESDAERLARQRAAYTVVQPTAVPQRSGPSGPNIVQYALSTTNALGQPVYRRGGLFAERKFRRNCARYPSSDLAQVAFLAEGGPERDSLGLDPDGDGFACAWDPAPFRAAQG